MDFTKLKNKKNTKKTAAPKKVYKEVVETKVTPPISPKTEEKVVEKIKTPPPTPKKARIPKKVGRKSWKKEGVEYTRIGIDVPKEMKQQLKILLFNQFDGKYISQDEMLNAALEQFIKKYNK